jgi:hypothetical protein
MMAALMSSAEVDEVEHDHKTNQKKAPNPFCHLQPLLHILQQAFSVRGSKGSKDMRGAEDGEEEPELFVRC